MKPTLVPLATAVPPPAVSTERVVNAPSSGWHVPDLAAVWHRRELLYYLVWRDIKVRYKQTVIGAAWAVLQPVLTMVVFSLVFGRVAGLGSDGVPYPIFAFVALVPWTFFANAMNQAASSLVAHERVLTKVWFPRLVVPVAAVLGVLVDLVLAFGVLLVMMGGYRIAPSPAILAIPFFLLLATAAALGIGLWLCALNVRYRDVRYVLPFLTQIWLFATPVAYSATVVPEPWRALYGMNPMVGVIDGFRWALLGTSSVPTASLLTSTAAAAALLVSGGLYFRRMEDTFADEV